MPVYRGAPDILQTGDSRLGGSLSHLIFRVGQQFHTLPMQANRLPTDCGRWRACALGLAHSNTGAITETPDEIATTNFTVRGTNAAQRTRGLS